MLKKRWEVMVMKHIFILNPAAGQADSTQATAEKIRAVFGAQAHIHYTTGVGDATSFVKQYASEHSDESLRFYACGGDGTLCEVVNGAYGFENVAVGLIPVGTGNDFVRNFEHTEQFHSIEAQKEGREVTIDLLRCNDRYCVNMINTGFDCEVVGSMVKIKRHVPAGMAYVLGVVIQLLKMPGATMDVTVDGEPVECGEKLLCAIANGGYYGGGFHPLPQASTNDGYLDMCLVNRVSRARFLSLIGSYKKGTHLNPKTVDVIDCFHARRVTLEFPEPRFVSMDGELLKMQRCDLELLPSALRFVVPMGSKPCGECAEQAETAAVGGAR